MSDIDAITYDDALTITPSDSTQQLTTPAAGLNVQVAGTVTLLTARKTKVTIGAAAGVNIGLAFLQIYATGTTATGITALIKSPYAGHP